MKQVDWMDGDGCLRRSLLPESAPEEQAPAGVPVGVEIEVGASAAEIRCRLQNQLRQRGFWTAEDMSRRRGEAHREVFAALQAAFRVDVTTIINQFLVERKDG